jgi:riboflavin kinase/FMN adenylyltransferase
MDVVWLPDATDRPRRLAVGEFDGVHAGHREVIRGADSVLTFEPHPRTVVAPAAAPKLLTTLEQKTDLIAALGVQELIVIPFDGSFSAQTAQEFIDHVLVANLGATWVSVGENFRFGNRARGDAELLLAQDAFETRVVEMVEMEGEIVSSTHIRGLVATGDVATAGRLLGAPFELRGIVAHGDKRGRTLGFPTANLVPDPAHAVPDHGIYATRAIVPGLGEWVAATSIGVRPTFVTGRGLLVEAFLLDFDGDLYGRELRLEFLERTRGERRFESVDALVEQMHEDVRQIERIAG